MSAIFDGFDSMDAAREFVAAVRERFGLDGQTFSSAEVAHQHDWFPFRQTPPIAHIDRPSSDRDDFLATEAAVRELVSEFGGGEFIGT
jgi:hypothetical protein